MREHRRRLYAQGLHPVEIWVPVISSATFRMEAHRQSLAVASSAHDGDDQAFVDAISDWPDRA
nr:antitoxin MazE family protein [Bradyrhizobium jicamae]